MTNSEILQKAFEKAYKNEWANKPEHYFNCMIEHSGKIGGPRDWLGKQLYFAEIFSHDFASAFWGEESVWSDNGESSAYISRRKEVSCLYSWQYHLSKMVLYKEPLEYLEKFL